MKCLIAGEHFGASKKKIQFSDCIFTEAGYEPGIAAPWHYHENAYFYYHLQGNLLEVNKKQKLLCTPGTALFHCWQDPHYDTDFSEDVRFFHIELSREWFAKVRQILHDCDPETINLDLLSTATGVHAVQLSREFARYFHTGFGNYMRKLRLDRAVTLLADDNRSIADIAYTCGYSDQSHFIRSFKKVYGISPLKYRKGH